MAWTVGDFKLELENIQMLMKVRKSPEMAQSLLNQLKTKLESHKWTATSLCEMMEACSACGLEDEHKEALLVVLEKTASSRVQADSNLKLASKPQSLIHIMNYMSAKDWDAMLAGNSWDCIILVAKRLRACGMVSLREDSKKWRAAFLVAVEMQKSGTAPPYDEIYRWSVSLHEAFVNLPNSNVPARNIYPEHPNQLGNDWILSVSGPDNAPAPKDCQVWQLRFKATHRFATQVHCFLGIKQSLAQKERVMTKTCSMAWLQARVRAAALTRLQLQGRIRKFCLRPWLLWESSKAHQSSHPLRQPSAATRQVRHWQTSFAKI